MAAPPLDFVDKDELTVKERNLLSITYKFVIFVAEFKTLTAYKAAQCKAYQRLMYDFVANGRNEIYVDK
ncbi:unnamed protein product [Arabidopsis thaliana]|uniref:Uncharacterized protein n=1 Tax=Arabidopsis thaliana TaxID=3702 RepID=A0A654FDH4_ARATH|nr:unnamed protein product [Arabidopsis thaliana]